jgi:hypothetical protein
MTYANSLPRREAGSLINRTVTMRTKARFRHPRTDGTALLLSTTTELVVIAVVKLSTFTIQTQIIACNFRFAQSNLRAAKSKQSCVREMRGLCFLLQISGVESISTP